MQICSPSDLTSSLRGAISDSDKNRTSNRRRFLHERLLNMIMSICPRPNTTAECFLLIAHPMQQRRLYWWGNYAASVSTLTLWDGWVDSFLRNEVGHLRVNKSGSLLSVCNTWASYWSLSSPVTSGCGRDSNDAPRWEIFQNHGHGWGYLQLTRPMEAYGKTYGRKIARVCCRFS